MTMRDWVFVVAVGSLSLTALVCDLRTRKIPNVLTVSGFVLGLVFQAFAGSAGLKDAAVGFAIGFGTLLVLWLVGGGGAGDVKLMGALGAWLGGRNTIYVLVLSAAIVAVGTVAILIIEWCVRGWGTMSRRYFAKFDAEQARSRGVHPKAALAKWRERRRIMPYAVPVGVATWLVLVWKVALPAL